LLTTHLLAFVVLFKNSGSFQPIILLAFISTQSWLLF